MSWTLGPALLPSRKSLIVSLRVVVMKRRDQATLMIPTFLVPNSLRPWDWACAEAISLSQPVRNSTFPSWIAERATVRILSGETSLKI